MIMVLILLMRYFKDGTNLFAITLDCCWEKFVFFMKEVKIIFRIIGSSTPLFGQHRLFYFIN